MNNVSKTPWSYDNQDDAWLDKPLTLRKGSKSSHSSVSISPNIKAFQHSQKQVFSTTYSSKQSNINHQTIKSLVKRNEALARELGKLKELNSQQNDKIRELNAELLNRKIIEKEVTKLVTTSTSPFDLPQKQKVERKKNIFDGENDKENLVKVTPSKTVHHKDGRKTNEYTHHIGRIARYQLNI